ncbi:unnamed protein product [Brassica rapa subsp. trilocularis]
MPQLFEGFCIDYNKSLINRFLMGLTELLLEPCISYIQDSDSIYEPHNM